MCVKTQKKREAGDRVGTTICAWCCPIQTDFVLLHGNWRYHLYRKRQKGMLELKIWMQMLIQRIKLHGRSCPSSIMQKGINLSLRLTIKNYRAIFSSVRFAKMKDEDPMTQIPLQLLKTQAPSVMVKMNLRQGWSQRRWGKKNQAKH